MEAFESVQVTDSSDESSSEKSFLDHLIDLIPFEIHAPGYRFLGPGTRIVDRLKRGETGVNPLDEACKDHDIAYANKKVNRRAADKEFADRAFARMIEADTSLGERSLALLTVCCMFSKISIDKTFLRIRRYLRSLCSKKNKRIRKTTKKND